MSVHVRVWARHAPKSGNSSQEYEDAFWPNRAARRRGPVFRCAVADGATEASFSGRWAELLTRAYCRGHFGNGRLAGTIGRLQATWSAEIGSKSLPWYAQEKVRQGAFSSLLGLTLCGGTWRALAVGDSCLFQIRDERVITAFPLTESGQFGNTPLLLSSNPRCNDTLADSLPAAGGDARPGDRFLLMTDALACWFLAAVERDERPWDDLSPARAGRAAFATWLAGLRTDRAIRNDDTTVLGADLLSI